MTSSKKEKKRDADKNNSISYLVKLEKLSLNNIDNFSNVISVYLKNYNFRDLDDYLSNKNNESLIEKVYEKQMSISRYDKLERFELVNQLIKKWKLKNTKKL